VTKKYLVRRASIISGSGIGTVVFDRRQGDCFGGHGLRRAEPESDKGNEGKRRWWSDDVVQSVCVCV